MEIPLPTHFAWRRSGPWRLVGLMVFLLGVTPVFGQQFVQQGGKLIGADAAGPAAQGTSVAPSADGNVAVVGCTSNQVPATQVEGVSAVWVFVWAGGVWHELGTKFVGTGGVETPNQRVTSVALSANGITLIVGGDSDASGTGAAWGFVRSGNDWIQQGTLRTRVSFGTQRVGGRKYD